MASMESMAETCVYLPGLPNELALLCFSKLPIDTVARCRTVSRSWASALLQYPLASRLPQALACLCVGELNSSGESSMAWFLLSRSDLRCRIVPFFSRAMAHTERIHVYSSQMQVIMTGTNLLLVRSRLTFCGELEMGTDGMNPCVDRALKEPGLLQAFDLWHMKWCKEDDFGTYSPPMHMRRWGFATALVGEHSYVAGGGGDGKAGKTAERLNMKTCKWEVFSEMIKERRECPAGFAMGGRFYVVGGELQPTTHTEGLTQSGEFYDPEKGTWELVDGMWPEEMWGFGSAPYVVVVKNKAYAIGKRWQVMRWTEKGSWEKAGHLPNSGKFEHAERWCCRLMSVGEDELWVVMAFVAFAGEECPWLVFSCKPYLSNDMLFWEHLPFTIPFSPQQGLATVGGIYI